jgi:hypothetical protein
MWKVVGWVCERFCQSNGRKTVGGGYPQVFRLHTDLVEIDLSSGRTNCRRPYVSLGHLRNSDLESLAPSGVEFTDGRVGRWETKFAPWLHRLAYAPKPSRIRERKIEPIRRCIDRLDGNFTRYATMLIVLIVCKSLSKGLVCYVFYGEITVLNLGVLSHIRGHSPDPPGS